MAYVINYKEVNSMPRMDGTGPMGAGSMLGRGLGICTDANGVKFGAGYGRGLGLGFGCRRGFGRGFGRGFTINRLSPKAQEELFHQEKTILQERLEAIDKQLDDR
jgi:hypothetical protein